MPAGTASVKAKCASALVDLDHSRPSCIVLPVISRLEMGCSKTAVHKTPARERLDLLGRLGGRCPITLHKLPSRDYLSPILRHSCRRYRVRVIVPGHKVRQMFGPVRRMIEEGRRGSRNQSAASDDIWHLSIEDLLAPPRNRRDCRRASSSSPEDIHGHDRFRRRKDCCPSMESMYTNHAQSRGRPQFQLRLGSSNPSRKPTRSSRWCVSTIRVRSRNGQKTTTRPRLRVQRAPAEPAKTARAVCGREGTCRSSIRRGRPASSTTGRTEASKHCLLDIERQVPSRPQPPRRFAAQRGTLHAQSRPCRRLLPVP